MDQEFKFNAEELLKLTAVMIVGDASPRMINQLQEQQVLLSKNPGNVVVIKIKG